MKQLNELMVLIQKNMTDENEKASIERLGMALALAVDSFATIRSLERMTKDKRFTYGLNKRGKLIQRVLAGKVKVVNGQEIEL